MAAGSAADDVLLLAAGGDAAEVFCAFWGRLIVSAGADQSDGAEHEKSSEHGNFSQKRACARHYTTHGTQRVNRPFRRDDSAIRRGNDAFYNCSVKRSLFQGCGCMRTKLSRSP